MYLMYVDESGDAGLERSPTRYFVLSGLVIHELRWKPLIEELISFRRDIKARFGFKLREEIHAGKMLTSPGDLARIPKHQRLEILRRYADILAGFPDLSVINVVVDKQNKPPDYLVFEMAWQALIQRFENTISARNFPGPRYADERGMLFAYSAVDGSVIRYDIDADELRDHDQRHVDREVFDEVDLAARLDLVDDHVGHLADVRLEPAHLPRAGRSTRR
jgi:hypothetical protein